MKPGIPPLGRFACLQEVKGSVHRGRRIEAQNSYSSVPPEFTCRAVWARWDGHLVRSFNSGREQIIVHVQVVRFETDVLCHPDNLDPLMAMPGQWVDRTRRHRPTDKLILDLDSSVSPTYGQQEGTADNGRFCCERYPPLFLFNQDGDLERALLRCSNVAGADEWQPALEPVIARCRIWEMSAKEFLYTNRAISL